MRIITTCIWFGPKTKVVHRTIHKNKSPFRDISAVQFTDGTTMDVSHTPAKPRERVEVINGYSSLLWDFVSKDMKGFCRVADLYQKSEVAK